uniref:Uncharacterized protein n=1 Tax=Arundo donax TaxID=35708 RepID=A0A0A9D735_ARUDO
MARRPVAASATTTV